MKEELKQIIDATAIIREIYKQKKEEKGNFNFFQALVNDKIHYEKYHSNFIAYLLNPKSSHDCGTLFLEGFLNKIKEKHEIDYEGINLNDVEVTIEKTTADGRIDIFIEYKSEWILFIENKIYSGEGEEQLHKYYEYCSNKIGKKPTGIFLTLKGEKATSIDSDEIISLSYFQIIDWLKECSKNEELSEKHNISNSIKQYISILEQILNIMNNEMMKEFEKEYLKDNIEKLPSLATIDMFRNAIIEYLCEDKPDIRENFYKQVREKLEVLFEENIDDNEKYYTKIHSSNKGGKDNGYGGWFEIFCKPKICSFWWDSIKIDGINDFEDIVGGTKKIKELGEKTVEDTANYIQAKVKEKIDKHILEN